MNWPARSPDLTPLDFFLWGHLKSKVYNRTMPGDEDDLLARIQEATDTVTEEMILCAQQDIIERARKCVAVNGGYFEHLPKR